VAPGSSFRHFASRFAIALALVLVATGVAISTGNRFFEETVDNIATTHIRDDLLVPEEKGEPANFLIIGTDTRSFVQTEEQRRAFGGTEEVVGQRSDTMMVVHVEPMTETGFVVSFPRDLWVVIPGHGEDRLNSALELGGPSLLIETLSQNFNVPINHYLEVDIDGFQRIVNTIGHVSIYFPAAARDTFSGLDQPAGCRELDGAQALTYVRARHLRYLDPDTGRWREDPRSDLGRIERQQYFMRSLAEAALDGGARNPATAIALLDDISDALSKDQNLDWADIRGLVNAFRDLDPSSIEMLTLPIVGTRRGEAQVLIPKEPDADPILNRLRTFTNAAAALPAAVAPEEISVRVVNGSRHDEWGDEVLEGLAAHGFETTGPAERGDRTDYPLTQIRWSADTEEQAGKALSAAFYLGTGNAVEARPGETGDADVVVVVGNDWGDLVALAKRPPDPDSTVATGETTAPDPAVSSTPDTPTTLAPTSTTPRSRAETLTVPVDPETGGPLVGCP
jgi:LCP family protein required for cell wall assembly